MSIVPATKRYVSDDRFRVRFFETIAQERHHAISAEVARCDRPAQDNSLDRDNRQFAAPGRTALGSHEGPMFLDDRKRKWIGMASAFVAGALTMAGTIVTLMDWWNRPSTRLAAVVEPFEYRLPPGLQTAGPEPKGLVRVTLRNGGRTNVDDVVVRIPPQLAASESVLPDNVVAFGTLRPKDVRSLYFWTQTKLSVDDLRRDLYLSHSTGEGVITVLVQADVSDLQRNSTVTSLLFIAVSIWLTIQSVSERHFRKIWMAALLKQPMSENPTTDPPQSDRVG